MERTNGAVHGNINGSLYEDWIARDYLMADLLIVTQRGYGKRVRVGALNLHSPGGKGVAAISLDENDAVAAVVLAEPGDDVIILTASGLAIRVRAGQLQEMPLNAGGEPLVSMPYPDHGAVDRVVGALAVPG
jgi:DNA gyrase subunit A